MAALVQIKLVSALIICVMISAPLATEAITCNQVASGVSGCLGYLKTTGAGSPPGGCCSGIKGLAGMAKTPADMRVACGCLKGLSGSIRGINYGTAGRLPSKCGVRIPYAISPSTDCNKIS